MILREKNSRRALIFGSLMGVCLGIWGCQQNVATRSRSHAPSQPMAQAIVVPMDAPVLPQKQPYENIFEALAAPIKTQTLSDEKLIVSLSNMPFSEMDFSTFLMSLAPRLIEVHPPFTRVEVMAIGEGDTVLTAHLALADMQAFLKSEISRPELLRRLDTHVDETPDSLLKKAREARSSGQNELARDSLEKLLTKNADSIEALSLLGNVYRDQKRFFEAMPLYKKILDRDPQSVFAWHNLGFCQDKVGVFSEASVAYAKALEIKPDSTLLMTQLAEAHRKNGEPDKALAWIVKARAVMDSADLWLIEGNVDRDLKKYKEAQAAYLSALKINPNEARALFNLILIDLDIKKVEEARKKFIELRQKDFTLAKELGTLGIFSGGQP